MANDKGWVVKLTKQPNHHTNYYPPGYFPRGFHYKKEALNLKKEVEEMGGKATVEKK